MSNRLEQASFLLTPELRYRIGLLADYHRLSRSEIVRQVLPGALETWHVRRQIEEAKRDLARALAAPTRRWVEP